MNKKERSYDVKIQFGKRKYYLDANIIIHFYSKDKLENRHKEVVEFFEKIRNINLESTNEFTIELCCSKFTITEFVKVYIKLVNTLKHEAYTFKIAKELLSITKIGRKI